MTPAEWRKTPYADTTVAVGQSQARTDELLKRYGVTAVQHTELLDADGKGATLVLRFHLGGRTYRVERHTLAAPQVDLGKRLRQLRQSLYWKLKTTLEDSVFTSIERELFGDLELPDGGTVWQAAAPALASHRSPAFGLMLPPKRD